MALPKPGGTAHGGGGDSASEPDTNPSTSSSPKSSSMILLKLNHGLAEEIQKTSQKSGPLSFEAGNTPSLCIGSRAISLLLSKEEFVHELYASTSASALAGFRFAGTITHRARVKRNTSRPRQPTENGTDEALAALQNTMASFEQEKKANQVKIGGEVLPMPRNRYEAARKQHRRMVSESGLQGEQTPPLGAASRVQLAPTSQPVNNEATVRVQAIKKVVVHLLAVKAVGTRELLEKTRVPREELLALVQKLAREMDGSWHLTDRTYKELDVWKFGYSSDEDRKAAIDNAIRAYDRLRIGRDEKLWQNLLPEKDRGKGIVLSRLHLGAKGGLTPNHHGASPSLKPSTAAAAEATLPSAGNTPWLGGTTPRSTPLAGKGGNIMKRLLSKDPKKANALAEAKEKKRKEKDAKRTAAAVTSDAEGERPTKKRAVAATSKYKSAERVHSEDDESGEEGEIDESITRVDSKLSPDKSHTTTSSQLTASNGERLAPATPKKVPADPAKSIASLASKAKSSPVLLGKATPKIASGLTAPTSQPKAQRSPQNSQNSQTAPGVPSPLGPTRPRGASDLLDRKAAGLQAAKQGKGLSHDTGTLSGARKRHDTITSTASTSSSDQQGHQSTEPKKQVKPASNGISSKTTKPDVKTPSSVDGLKRNAGEADSAHIRPLKQRKIQSSSTASQDRSTAATSNGTTKTQTTAHTSPDDATFESSTASASISNVSGGNTSDSAASVLDPLTYAQGVNLAEKFQNVYYPRYAALYDSLAAKLAKGDKPSKEEREHLMAMHGRLEQMKREIEEASRRED